jgi:hypothetical protein
MTSDRKKPDVAFWASVVVVLAFVAYPLSWGPAAWACALLGEPPWADAVYFRIYGPLLWVYGHGPQLVNDVLDWYGNLWI